MKNEITIRKLDRLEELLQVLPASLSLQQGRNCDIFSNQEWLDFLDEIVERVDIRISTQELLCLIDYIQAHNQDDEVLKEQKRCLFEKKYCEYAKREGRKFECTAPSDEAMPCKEEKINYENDARIKYSR